MCRRPPSQRGLQRNVLSLLRPPSYLQASEIPLRKPPAYSHAHVYVSPSLILFSQLQGSLPSLDTFLFHPIRFSSGELELRFPTRDGMK